MSDTQHPSNIAYAIHNDLGVHRRIEAVVRKNLWSGTGDPTVPLPAYDLSWAVASNPTIFNGVTKAIVDGDINAAVAQIPDSDLEYVVLEAQKRLDALSTPTPAV